MSAAVPRFIVALVVSLIASTLPLKCVAVEAGTSGKAVYMVGDSLTFLAEPNVSAALSAVGWSTTRIDAFEGRGVDFTLPGRPDTGLRAVDALRAAYGDSDDWIVALGTNEVLFRDPATYPGAIRRMLDRIGVGHRVMWVNTYLPDHPAKQALWNSALDAAAAERNGDLAVFDIATVNAQHPEWMLYDNVHHNVDGNAGWADAIGAASRGVLLPAQQTSNPAPAMTSAAAPSGYVAVGPERILDTRTVGTPVAARSITRIDASGSLPTGTNAIAINLTVVEYASSGFAAAFPCASGLPDTSTVNFSATGPPQSTSTIVQVDAEELLCVYTSSATHLAVDLFGAFVPAAGAPMATLGPDRLIDTRLGGQPVRDARSVLRVPVPISATAVVVNLTVDDIAADGYLTAWPCAHDQPNVSNLNYAVSERQKANVAVIPIAADGMLCIYNNAPAAIIVDLLAIFAPGLANLFHPLDPTRVLDTRTGAGGWIGHTAPGQAVTAGPFGLEPGAVVVGSVTVTNALGSGYVTAWSGAGSVPPTSNVNFLNGSTRPNMLMVATAPDGMFRVTQGPSGRTDVIVDVTGWFSPA